MNPLQDKQMQDLLGSMQLKGDDLLWPSDNYYFWLDKLARTKDKERAAVTERLIALAYKIKAEIIGNSDDAMTKLYACISLLQQGLSEQQANEKAEDADVSGEQAFREDEQAVQEEKTILEWFAEQS